jgi:hypothetical protein
MYTKGSYLFHTFEDQEGFSVGAWIVQKTQHNRWWTFKLPVF